jgi:hypothetical protein
MTNTTLLHPTATWRSAASRLRSCVQSCSSMNAYAMKPATEVAIFGTNRPTRRGAPPQ